MITRDELIGSMLEEIRICKFLAAKIPGDRVDWRPTANQRSVLELLRYITRAGEGFTTTLVYGNRDHADRLLKRAEGTTLANFDRVMDEQAANLKAMIGGLSSDRLTNERKSMPWGGPEMSLAAAIMNSGVKFLAAYRMQLFLYLKLLGKCELGTAECWAGREPAKQA
ncbi:MAG: hypothetical protein H6839_09625 [Planctomycetes bacterium]|nr:hypothetical protein [Planctomycetota bacterium]